MQSYSPAVRTYTMPSPDPKNLNPETVRRPGQTFLAAGAGLLSQCNGRQGAPKVAQSSVLQSLNYGPIYTLNPPSERTAGLQTALSVIGKRVVTFDFSTAVFSLAVL